ncbi:AAA-like domain-containing protein [Iningainema tapete]|nr:AAA-like domain-containing protein [Iningainema tapete]
MADVTANINQARAMRVAVNRIEGFAKQFGEAHRNLARHAAFPLVLTPDLLYQIWANFVPEAPWTAVAHVLLSRLCRQVGYEMYEMDITDRNLLLRELKKQFGQERFDELGEFLLDYVAQRLTDDDPDTQDLAQAQEWTALVYTKPVEAARELAQALSARVKQEDMAEVLRLASLVETLAEPLVEMGFEPLLVYSRGMKSFVSDDLDRAAKQFRQLPQQGRRVQVAGVSLDIPSAAPIPPMPVAEPELPEGQVDLTSAFYVERSPIESRCYEEILKPGGFIRIKAPRQMGKTSLMMRILDKASQQGFLAVHLNFQLADRKVFANLEQFLHWFCASVGQKLGLPNKLADYWDEILGSKLNCTVYFQEYLLAQINQPLVLGLDEVDLAFQHLEIVADFFGLLRAWHEEAKNLDIWKKLRLILVHSTEVYIPLNITQSPMNVGLAIELPEFNAEQVLSLAQRHGLNWSSTQVEQLMAMVGGHPYLVRVALYQIARSEMTLEQLLQIAHTAEFPYSDHLHRHLLNLEENQELLAAMKQVVAAINPVRIDSRAAFKLRSMGLVKFRGNNVQPLCDLYRHYFRNRLDYKHLNEEVYENYFQVGGSLRFDTPSYVTRQADQDLYEALKAREFCYQLGSRQMGRSSLRVRTRERLQAEGIVCAVINLTTIGSQQLTPEQWYGGVVRSLVSRFKLSEKFNLRSWWRDRDRISPVQRLSEFIEEVLLVEISQQIVIFVDEIDSVFSLNFSIDDFFALIRDCYDQRANKPEYNRLTFAVLGVATLADLIQDKKRTPFDIGRAIKLNGFTLHEVQPLAQGLVEKVDNPQAVLREVLSWTGGQPFLTQKLCKLVSNSEYPISAGSEAQRVELLVQTQVIENWESQDEPEHLKTICDRLLRSGRSSQMLILYQQILQQGEVVTDDSPEQTKLLLSGLVVEQRGKLRVYNRIYKSVFNAAWVDLVMATTGMA